MYAAIKDYERRMRACEEAIKAQETELNYLRLMHEAALAEHEAEVAKLPEGRLPELEAAARDVAETCMGRGLFRPLDTVMAGSIFVVESSSERDGTLSIKLRFRYRMEKRVFGYIYIPVHVASICFARAEQKYVMWVGPDEGPDTEHPGTMCTYDEAHAKIFAVMGEVKRNYATYEL